MSRYLAAHKAPIALTAVYALITVVINLFMPYILRLAIDGLTAGTLTPPVLWRYVLLFAGLTVFAAWFSRQLRRMPLKLAHRIEYDVRRDLFEHLTKLDQEFFRKERTGNLMTRMSSDMTIVCDAVGQGLLQGIRTGLALLFASIVMVWINPMLAGLMFALYLPIVIVFFLVLTVMRKRQKTLQEQVSEISNFAQESFSGIRCIKGFAIEPRRTGLFETMNRELIRKNIQLQTAMQLLWPLMAFWFSIGMLLLLNVGGKQVIRGTVSMGVLVQFLQYLLYMQWPLLALSWTAGLLQRGKVSWRRIKELFDREPLIRDSAETDFSIQSLDGEIEWRNVSLDIDGKRFLQNIDLKIPAGKTVGITGPTGSGKTLLTSLPARLMDVSEGVLLVGGHPVKKIPLHLLRRNIGCAAQEPVLFSQTLEHNIAFGMETPDDPVVDWAAGIAHLHGDIEGFPDHYKTLLGERGITLSGGQRQRTSISRAVARRPQILILDDVLSSVDTQTEADIMAKLQPVMKNSTCLFVSHRISTLRYTDEIIVIEGGRITARGTHDELIARPGYYAELNAMQQLQEKLEAGQ